MDGNTTPAQAAGDSLVTLGEVAGTVEVQKLKDSLAALDRAGATFYIAVSNQPVEVWGHRYDDEGVLQPQIIEVLNDFADDHAHLTRDGIRASLVAEKNALLVEQVHSDQPGLRNGGGHGNYYDVVLTSPITCNLSELKVASTYARQTAIKATPATALPSAATDCEPIALSEAKEMWVKENRIENGGTWKKATVSNYDSYVQQFITLVGNKLTTQLQARDFADYEKMMRTLPADWYATHKRTELSPAQIALSKSDTKLSPKTLKDKGSAISLFFSYLEQKGFWHGRYGAALFSTVKPSKAKKPRHVFSNDELKILYAGAGIETFKNAKFPLYAWGSMLLKNAGMKKKGVVLYSLRHTVINRFKADATMDHYACAYTGHSTADDKAISNQIYRERYGRAFTPTLLAERLHPLLDFDIDWSPLKGVIDEKGWASPTLAQPSSKPRKEVPRTATPHRAKLVASKT